MKNIIALALVAILAVSCSQEETKQQKLDKLKTEIAKLVKEKDALEKELEGSDTNQVAIPVRLQTISTRAFKRPVEIQGVVESDNNVEITSEVVGRVMAIQVKEGQRVTAGQLLARIDGGITASSINEVENALKLAETTFQKQKRLRDQNVGTEMQLIQAESQRDALKKQLETLRAQYSKYSITAPVSGIVDDLFVNPGENIMPGMRIVRVVNNTNLKVRAEVSEKYVRAVKTGDSVIINFPGINEQVGSKISSVGQVIDPNNRTFSVLVNLTKATQNLKPNLLAMVTVYDYVNPNAIAVPSNVIFNESTEKFVYIAIEKGGKTTAKKVAVKTGQTANAYTEILDGLKTGDKIITDNVPNVMDGDALTIIK